MKLTNTTSYPNHFMRRMVAWCCRQIGLPVNGIREIYFRNRDDGFTSGHAWWPSNRIVVSCGACIEDIVRVTAHEVFHLYAHRAGIKSRRGRRGSSESQTRWHDKRALIAFQTDREALIAAWSVEPARKAQPQKSVVERRAEKAADDLARWQRKAKLAATKIRKLKQRVRYYDRKAAASALIERQANAE